MNSIKAQSRPISQATISSAVANLSEDLARQPFVKLGKGKFILKATGEELTGYEKQKAASLWYYHCNKNPEQQADKAAYDKKRQMQRKKMKLVTKRVVALFAGNLCEDDLPSEGIEEIFSVADAEKEDILVKNMTMEAMADLQEIAKDPGLNFSWIMAKECYFNGERKPNPDDPKSHIRAKRGMSLVVDNRDERVLSLSGTDGSGRINFGQEPTPPSAVAVAQGKITSQELYVKGRQYGNYWKGIATRVEQSLQEESKAHDETKIMLDMAKQKSARAKAKLQRVRAERHYLQQELTKLRRKKRSAEESGIF
ncbi:hypothetical protein IV203_005570 [Nitzschia inconspicua]|uniref:Uncharacterized protein n=1 Tax=Nitzschia inconspicua TaxID=303405 RepID=A0A9K3KML2_9STRA|nr:hypothetical protein IV203_005570 [Nitzschia inconspicua]